MPTEVLPLKTTGSIRLNSIEFYAAAMPGLQCCRVIYININEHTFICSNVSHIHI